MRGESEELALTALYTIAGSLIFLIICTIYCFCRHRRRLQLDDILGDDQDLAQLHDGTILHPIPLSILLGERDEVPRLRDRDSALGSHGESPRSRDRDSDSAFNSKMFETVDQVQSREQAADDSKSPFHREQKSGFRQAHRPNLIWRSRSYGSLRQAPQLARKIPRSQSAESLPQKSDFRTSFQ